jgi:hypothetical protein
MTEFFSTLLSFRLRRTFLPILFFLFATVVATLVVRLVFAGDSVRIAAFGAAVLALSLIFPRLLRPVDKESADFIYYFAGIVVAALVFFGKDVERKQIELTAKIQELGQQQRYADADIAGFDAAFDYVKGNIPKVLLWVNDRVDESLKETELARGQECACAMSQTLCNGLALPSGITPRDQVQPPARSFGADARCKVLNDVLRQAAPDSNRSSRDLVKTLRLARLVGADGSISADGSVFSAAQVVAALDNVAGGGDTLARLVAKKERIAQEMLSTQATLDGLGKSEKSGISLIASEIVGFDWPYLLIAFLGLRIARFDYFDRPVTRA